MLLTIYQFLCYFSFPDSRYTDSPLFLDSNRNRCGNSSIGKLVNHLPLCFRHPNRIFLSNGKHPRGLVLCSSTLDSLRTQMNFRSSVRSDAVTENTPVFVQLCRLTPRKKKKRHFSRHIFIQTPSRSLDFSVNFYLYLPALHPQPQNHILKANRATALDPWCV